MSPLPFQIGLTALFGVAIARLIIRARSNRVRPGSAFVWVSLWLAGLSVVWLPLLTTRFAHLLGIGRGVDAVLYVSVAVLSYMLFRVYVALERLEEEITSLVSRLALNDWQRHSEGGSVGDERTREPLAGGLRSIFNRDRDPDI